MCVCVCFWDPCAKKLLLRDDFESLICWLDHWLSCILDCIHVYVFLLSKNCFEKLAWHFLNTSSIASYLLSFLSFFLSQSRQHLDTWWINWTSVLDQVFLFLDIFLTPASVDEHFLNTYLDRWLDTSRHLICQDLLRIYLSFLVRSDPHFSRSLSR